jgi:hypothetical protein
LAYREYAEARPKRRTLADAIAAWMPFRLNSAPCYPNRKGVAGTAARLNPGNAALDLRIANKLHGLTICKLSISAC